MLEKLYLPRRLHGAAEPEQCCAVEEDGSRKGGLELAVLALVERASFDADARVPEAGPPGVGTGGGATLGVVRELAATERRVAALVAQGRTNREIAAAMFVTENTVQTHIRHVFRKLGLRSRTELAVQFLSEPPGAEWACPPSQESELRQYQ